MSFVIKIEPEAREDIQSSIDWYNKQQLGLGKKFLKEIHKSFDSLSNNPFYQKRYKSIFCLPTNKFPFMIHFTIDNENKIVTV